MPKKINIKRFLFGGLKPGICIHGHFNNKRGFGVKDYYPEINQAITFLRDPLEVQLSVFFYNHKLSKTGELFRDGKPKEITKDVDEFLETSNPYFRAFLPTDMNENNLDEYFSNYFVHVGLMEDFEKSMRILSEKLNKPFLKIPFENKSDRFVNPSNSATKKFVEKCEFEYAIYNRALNENV